MLPIKALKVQELAREERELNKPKNWGEMTYKSLKSREHIPINNHDEPPRKAVGLALLRNPTVSGPLDASSVINELDETDLCDFFARYPQLKILCIRDWQVLSQRVVRAISFSFGEQLLELDFSSSFVNASHLEIILVRATKIQVLKLNKCSEVNTMAMNTVAKLSNTTLKELYLSNCMQCSLEPLLCIGGCSGFKSPSLSKLQALDLGECPVLDGGLSAIAHGCRKLMFLNLYNCMEITDESMVPIAESCRKMQLLNVSGCQKITTKSAVAIGRNMHHLISLNLSRCPLITDKGIKAIAGGCHNLQAVNVAGLLKLSEESIYQLADNCKGLLMLNVTGCERITINGLENLIEGLKFVEKGVSFMGFKPIDEHIEKKLSNHLIMLERTAMHERNEKLQAELKRQEEEQAAYNAFIHKTVATIHDYMYRYKLRMHFYRLWRKRVQRQSACIIQRVYRGIKGRERAARFREERNHFLASAPYALLIQQNVRAYLCRLHNEHVSKAIRLMYMMRNQEAQNAVAVRFQSHIRRYLACLRVNAVKELKTRRLLNMNHAILLMQMMVRRYLSKQLLYRKRREKRNADIARANASIKIKVFLLERMRRYKSKLSGDELKRFFRHKWTASTTIQAFHRGFKGRERTRKIKINMAIRNYAATQIQRIYRGTRILYWKDMRLNVIASYVLDRHYVERGVAVAASKLRYKQFVAENNRDSASDEEDDVEQEVNWTKAYDEKRKRFYWQNYATNEITFDEPLVPLAHEKALIGRRVRVFWTVQAAWYEGTVTVYHRRKKRHRVEYDDGDHEWMNFPKECDRVQVQMDDGHWVAYLLFQSDEDKVEWQKLEDKRDRDDFKKQAFEDALQWKQFMDDHTHNIMFLSTRTGEIRTGVPFADEWVVQDDGFGFPCFLNSSSQAVVYEDPRFVYDVDADISQQRKYVFQEMRFALYFCKDLREKYMAAVTTNDSKQISQALLNIRNSPKPIHLDSFIIRAKALYEVKSVLDRPVDRAVTEEIEYASWMAARMGELKQKAEELVLARRDNKKLVVDKLTANSGQRVFCRYCTRETKRHLEYCPTCGKPQLFY